MADKKDPLSGLSEKEKEFLGTFNDLDSGDPKNTEKNNSSATPPSLTDEQIEAIAEEVLNFRPLEIKGVDDAVNESKSTDSPNSECLALVPTYRSKPRQSGLRKWMYAAGIALGVALSSYFVSHSHQKPAPAAQTLNLPPVVLEERVKTNELVQLPKRKKLHTRDIMSSPKNIRKIDRNGETYVSFDVHVKSKGSKKTVLYAFPRNNPNPGYASVSEVVNGKAEFTIRYTGKIGTVNFIHLDGSHQTASYKKELNLDSIAQTENRKKAESGRTIQTARQSFVDYYGSGSTTAYDVSVFEGDIKKIVGYKNSNPGKSLKKIASESGIEWITDESIANMALKEGQLHGMKISRFDASLAPKEMIDEMINSKKSLRKIAEELTEKYGIHVSKTTVGNYRTRAKNAC